MTNTTERRTARRARLLAVGAVLAGSVLVSAQACAQGQQQEGRERGGRTERRMDPAQRVERRVALLTERLQLSSRRQTEVRQILTEEGEQVQALFPNGRGPGDFRGPRGQGDERRRGDANRPDSARREEMRAAMEKMRALRERTEQRIDGVLTERQRVAYRELREEQRKQFEQRDSARQRRPRG
jgi:hypothetical protein